MTTSNQVAGSIGPTLIVLSASEAMNLSIWTDAVPAMIYLNGAILFVAGLAIVRVHDRWTAHWPVMVTITGWSAMLGGLYRMFAPRASQTGESIATYAVLAILFTVGSIITFKAYRGDGA